MFKSAIGTLTEGKDYLLPIRLLTNSGSVNENKNLLCLKPNVLTPSVLLREPVNGKLDVTMSTEDAETEKTVEVRYYLDLKMNGISLLILKRCSTTNSSSKCI